MAAILKAEGKIIVFSDNELKKKSEKFATIFSDINEKHLFVKPRRDFENLDVSFLLQLMTDFLIPSKNDIMIMK